MSDELPADAITAQAAALERDKIRQTAIAVDAHYWTRREAGGQSFYGEEPFANLIGGTMPEDAQTVRDASAAQAAAAERERTDAVYRERDQLVAALSKLFPAHFANHDDVDWDDQWRNVVCIHLPTGQVTWHIHVSEVPLFGHLTIRQQHWDGHDTPEKYRRLNALAPTVDLLGDTADGAHTPGGTT